MTTAALRFELSATMDGFRSAVSEAEARWHQATGAMRRAAGDATTGMSGLGERAKSSFTGVSQAANAAATAMRFETAAGAAAAAATLDTMAERSSASFARLEPAARLAKQKIEQDFSELYAATARTFSTIADGAERSFADLYPAVAASTSKASQAVASAAQVTERTFADLVPAVAASTQASAGAVASFSERAKAAFAGLAQSARGAIGATEQSFADLYPPTERTRGVFASLADRARSSFAALGEAAQTGTQAAEAALQRHSGVVGTMTASLSRQLSGAVGAYLGFAAIGATVRGAINATKEIDDLGDIADAAGLTTTKYQELRFAAEQTGAAHEEFDRAILKFSEGLGGVRTHSGELYQFLRDTAPVLLQQLQTTQDTSAAFDLMANSIRGLMTPQDQAILRAKAFGEVGRKVADMLSSDYKAAGRQAQEFGVIWSREVIDKASATQREWVGATSVFEHSLKDALRNILPVATGVLNTFNAIATVIREIGTWLSNTPIAKQANDYYATLHDRLASEGKAHPSYAFTEDQLQTKLQSTETEIAALEQRLADRKATGWSNPWTGLGNVLKDGSEANMEAQLAKLKEEQGDYHKRLVLSWMKGTIVETPKPPPPADPWSLAKTDTGRSGTDVYKELKADLDATIKLQQKMTETVGGTEGAMARYRAEIAIANAVQREGKSLTAAQQTELYGLTQQLEAATDAAEQARSRFETFMEVGQTVASTLEDAFGRMISGTKVNFKDLVNGMLQDLAKLAFRANVVEPLFGGRSGNGAWGSLFGSVAGGLGGGSGPAAGSFRAAQEATGGGFFSSLASSVGSAFGGFRERGGEVQPGKAYVVGEKRPELFVPDVPGTIVPAVPPMATVPGVSQRPERSFIQASFAPPRLGVRAVQALPAATAPALTPPRTLALVAPVASVPRVAAPAPLALPAPTLARVGRGNGVGGYFGKAIAYGMRAVQSFAAQPASQGHGALGAITAGVGDVLATKGGTPFGGFREAGGDVEAGRSYVVGEKRPELFVPRVSGSIMPRLPAIPPAVPAAQPANMGAGPVTVTNVYNIDARAAEIGVERRIMAGLAMIERNRPSAAAVVAQQSRRHPYRAA